MGSGRSRGGIAALALALVALGAAPATAAPPVTAWRSPPLDGIVQGRPAIVGDVAVVATESDSLYGLSVRDGHQLWGPVHVGEPVPHAVIAELSPAATHCGDIDPLGITSSPAVDAGTGRVFAVAEVMPTTGRVPVHELVGVDAATGRLVVGPTPIDPPAMAHPELEQQRAGLSVANGNVYVGFGGLYGDCGDYHGFVVAARVDGGGITASFETANVVPGNRAGAVWATAPIPVDGSGTLYVATGNAERSPPEGPLSDHGDAVVALPPGLAAPSAEFQPSTWQSDNADDADLGSTEPVLLGGGLLLQAGKSGHAYLVDASTLGGVDRHHADAVLDVCGAYGANAVIGSSVFLACQSRVQEVRVVAGASPGLRRGWTAPQGGGPIIVGAGLVWSVDTGDRVLYGLSPATGRVVARHPVDLDETQHFPTVALAAGWLVVGAGSRVEGFRVPATSSRGR